MTQAAVAERLLRLAVRCPSCGASPPIRVSVSERDAHAGDDPERLVATLQCHRRHCQAIFEIRSRDIQRAA